MMVCESRLTDCIEMLAEQAKGLFANDPKLATWLTNEVNGRNTQAKSRRLSRQRSKSAYRRSKSAHRNQTHWNGQANYSWQRQANYSWQRGQDEWWS